jgi:hypothetical protein
MQLQIYSYIVSMRSNDKSGTSNLIAVISPTACSPASDRASVLSLSYVSLRSDSATSTGQQSGMPPQTLTTLHIRYVSPFLQGTNALRESTDIAPLCFKTSALEGGEGLASSSGRFLPPIKTRYPLYSRLGGPQGRSGEVRKIPPHRDSISGQSIP